MWEGAGGENRTRNKRFTKQWRSVPFRSTGFDTDDSDRIQAHFALSCVPLRSVESMCFAGGFAGSIRGGYSEQADRGVGKCSCSSSFPMGFIATGTRLGKRIY